MRTAALCAALALVLLAGCGGGDEDAAGTTATGADTTDATQTTTTGSAGCADVEAPAPRAPGTREAPALLSEATTYRVVVDTSCGAFTITLDQKTSPRAVASFVALARDGFFDDTTFHRIVPGFVIQGGDPTAEGTGGPGYQTVDAPAANTRYTEGTVAMAKGPNDPRGAAGSQFFIMTADVPTLPADYAVIGRVTEGIEVVLRIGTLGDAATELPTQAIVVERMTVEED